MLADVWERGHLNKECRKSGVDVPSCFPTASCQAQLLNRLLGTKTGLALWQFAHGRDDRSVEPPKVRKSVGAEVNWGIRFDGVCVCAKGCPEDPQHAALSSIAAFHFSKF
eukprot:scaffold145316_cov20-Tisochrysis_lutea.AAC.2